MNHKRLYEILAATTVTYRKGPEVETRRESIIAVTEFYMMPHVSEARADLEKVDVEFMIIGVDKAKAETIKDDLIEILKTYPQPDRLAGGPSYIEVGAEIGSQDAALRLFALGTVLGLWKLITPTVCGIQGEEAIGLARNGFVMITGWRAS